jgi:hypothetical protein
MPERRRVTNTERIGTVEDALDDLRDRVAEHEDGDERRHGDVMARIGRVEGKVDDLLRRLDVREAERAEAKVAAQALAATRAHRLQLVKQAVAALGSIGTIVGLVYGATQTSVPKRLEDAASAMAAQVGEVLDSEAGDTDR